MPFYKSSLPVIRVCLLITSFISSGLSFQPVTLLTRFSHSTTQMRPLQQEGTSNSRNLSFICLGAQVGSDEGDTTPGGDSYEGEIDWDAEWKKVVQQKGQKLDRPGKDFYKNDAQKVAAKATRVASEQIQKIKVVKPDVNLRMLSGDARFWIGILAIISIGLALITAPDTSSYSSYNESFYI
mmetsp:Transcript_12336/g.23117  ORF Transcript_12336/g.23117 Transcript_12336/m.23117 type:complete len:182 (+) Transcript_12336:139-684(+)